MDKTNASSCQITLRRLDLAFTAFFRRVKAGETPGYPRFKGRDRFDSVTFTGVHDGAKFTGHTVYLQHIGDIRVKMHRPVEGVIKQISVKREADGWYVVLACELPDVEIAPSLLPAVGIDLGLKAFAATSDGRMFPAPKLYRKAEKQLRKAQRALARCKRGSSRRKAVKNRVARLHQRTARQRTDFQYKLVAELLREYGAFAVEDLTIHGMVHGTLAKSIYDAAWGGFLDKLTRKAASAGAEVVAVNPQNTTQACSRCGCLPDVKLTLDDRVYRCLSCGLVLDRDINAARGILLKSGLLEAVGRERGSLERALPEKLPALAGST